MSRLTKRNDSGGITVEDVPAALKKLAELEDADADRRLAMSKTGQVIFANKRFVYVVNCVAREDWNAAFQKQV